MTDSRLLADMARPNRNWRDSANCRDLEPELFYPTGNTGPAALQIEEAKAACRRCLAVEDCLQWALNSGEHFGVWGGLSEDERRGLRRSAQRRNLPPEEVAAKVQRTRQALTLQQVFDDSTRSLPRGHLAWAGKAQTRLHGEVFTPKQVCFIVDRGHPPVGRVLAECGQDECVLPEHLSDSAERTRCGTLGGFRKHLADETEVCRHCRRAKEAADNRRSDSAKATA